MTKEELILKAEEFLNKEASKLFPFGISAPIIAKFADGVINNELSLSREDLFYQAKTFLLEEELEEVFYFMKSFVDAMVDFVSSFIKNQTNIKSIEC